MKTNLFFSFRDEKSAADLANGNGGWTAEQQVVCKISICISIYLYVYLYVSLSICMSIYLNVYLFIYAYLPYLT